MAKGVSAAEKKERMIKLFRESKDVFNKKEIESRASKAGIISNAVLGVLKELVGDDLVREEKVGISTYWWSFPGEDAAKKRRELSEEQAAVAELRPKLEQLQQQQASAAAAVGGEGEAGELQALETANDALRARQKAAGDELTKLAKHGADDWGARKADLTVLLEGANRWTDNLFTLKKYMTDKHGMESKQASRSVAPHCTVPEPRPDAAYTPSTRPSPPFSKPPRPGCSWLKMKEDFDYVEVSLKTSA